MHMAPLSFLLLLIWICTSAILTVSAEFVNITIDDYYRDALFEYFIYSPSGAWTAAMRPGEVTYNTWHQTNVTKDPTVTPSEVKATVTFTGSSVYVFGVLASTSSTQLRFRLNGTALSDNFTFSAQPGPTTYSYNQLLYANESLPEATHRLDILNGDVEGGAGSLLVVDYLVYTRNTDIDPLPSP
ncbi:uncharacterized protein BXZ73DRAFT_102618 [Epithele typhae]|uniref:uncharacterized protein n=1 Tax=Epithele typhae TaxID=378194 RepID=UPI0020083DC8|nr:uncharacterized protein BXZ73DRAFT_102618 [Epithele typhae]KAH9927486.1 hypothetical protein BXZ73DRAFT_102618 [Epithele typhae]